MMVSRRDAEEARAKWIANSKLEAGETRTYRYGRCSKLALPAAVWTLGVAALLYPCAILAANEHTPKVISCLLLVLMGIGLLFVIVTSYALVRALEVTFSWLPRHRRDEITVAPEFLQWTDGTVVIRTEWSGITGVWQKIGSGSRYKVVTDGGEFEIDFSFLKEQWELKGIWIRYGPEINSG
jgi:hypothetical protein